MLFPLVNVCKQILINEKKHEINLVVHHISQQCKIPEILYVKVGSTSIYVFLEYISVFTLPLRLFKFPVSVSYICLFFFLIFSELFDPGIV